MDNRFSSPKSDVGRSGRDRFLLDTFNALLLYPQYVKKGAGTGQLYMMLKVSLEDTETGFRGLSTIPVLY